MRKSYPSYSLLTLSGLIFAGSCSIIAEVDRTKIPPEGTNPGDGGQGTGGSTGGSAGRGGTGATPAGGTGGDAGGGGEPTGGTSTGGVSGDAGGGMGGAGMGGADGGMGGEPGVCGNGEVEAGETCDDDETTPMSDDGCSATCQEEAGWTCTGEPSTCVAAACGDRIQAGAEMCDDGNANACGTCSLNCGTQTPSAVATGSITLGASAPVDIDDGDYFTLNDGANPAVEFEFDAAPGDGVTGPRVAIVFDPAAADTALQAAIIAAINGVTTTLRIQASAGTGANINLANQLFGTIGNRTTGDNVMETSFTISAMMSGGAGHDCAMGTGCSIDADCANGDCLATNLCN